MIKTERISKTVEESEIKSASCDWCGEEFTEDRIKCNGYGEVCITFGWGSKYDTGTPSERWVGEVCEDCFERHFKGRMRQGVE